MDQTNRPSIMNEMSPVPQIDLPPFWDDPQSVGEPIGLISLAGAYISRWPFLLMLTAIGALGAFSVSLLLAPRYTSQAVFLPPTQQISSSDNPLSLLIKTPSSAIYTGLLLSDSVLNDVLEHTDVHTLFKARDAEEARAGLRQLIGVSTNTSGFVTLQVTCRDAHLAQEIAVNSMAALARLNNRLAVSQVAQQRQVYQTELEREKNDLAAAEVELKQAQERSGVVLPQSQTLAGLSAIDGARANIRARQVALAAMLQGETEQSPNVVRARSEITAEQVQLRQLEDSAGGPSGGGLSAAQAPSVNLRFVQLEREVKYHQVLFDVMAKQFEEAKLQESSAAPAVQVVDTPELPLHKSWPRRSIFTLLGGLSGLLLGCATVFIKNRLVVLRHDAGRAQSLEWLRAAWSKASLRP